MISTGTFMLFQPHGRVVEAEIIFNERGSKVDTIPVL